MSGLLYRSHRSQTFGELIGQEHVVAVLQEALRQNRVAHAYLFSGPRGVGKTSVARLLAKAVNCEKRSDASNDACDTCDTCIAVRDGRSLDVMELDAASNRGIDDMRELREQVRMAPSQLRKRMVIIDEVHMLTREAFQALLKTLEEPPEHTMFALATTEPHKVPVTIRSRCQQFAFHFVPADTMVKHLKYVSTLENITVTDDALALIVRGGEGSVRDSLSLLSQVATLDQNITKEVVEQTFGWADQAAIQSLCEQMIAQQGAQALNQVCTLFEKGTDPAMLLDACVEQLRAWMVVAAGAVQDASLPVGSSVSRIRLVLVRILEAQQMRTASPDVVLELALMHDDIVGEHAPEQGGPTEKPDESAPKELRQEESLTQKPLKEEVQQELEAKESPVETSVKEVAAAVSVTLTDVRSAWSHMRTMVAKISPMLSAGFNELVPVEVEAGDPCIVTIAGSFEIHVQRWQQADTQTVLKDMAQEYLGGAVKWSVVSMGDVEEDIASAAMAWKEQSVQQEQKQQERQEQADTASERRPVFGKTVPSVDPAPRAA